MIIDDIGEMAILSQMAQESGRVSIAVMDRIRELQETGRADCCKDLAMRELIRDMASLIVCIGELEKRYPEISDEIMKELTLNKTQCRKQIRKSDRKFRDGILKAIR